MSLVFSNPTLKSGIVERIYKKTGSSNDSYPIAEVTSDVNSALDEVIALILSCGTTWKFDDTNHSKYPIITTNLNSGQRDYPILVDEQGNLVLDIFKVEIAQPNGQFIYIYPTNAENIPNNANSDDDASFYNGAGATGVPTSYDKMANGIFLNYLPNYTVANGLKLYINREGSYFVSTDTTKKPGIAGLFHEYLVLQPAYNRAVDKGLGNAVALGNALELMKRSIRSYYGKRERDVRQRLQGNVENSK